MTREEISEALGNINSKFVQRAAQYQVSPQIGGRRVQKRQISFPWKILTALAACFALVTGLFFWTGKDNSFVVQACAVTLDDQNQISLQEIDPKNPEGHWGKLVKEDRIYYNTNLRYHGQNIRRVTFTLEEGEFAIQRLPEALGSDGKKPLMYAGDGHALMFYGDEFELMGPSITFEGDTIPDNILLFWSLRGLDERLLPTYPVITAEVTFKNGAKQTETFAWKHRGFTGGITSESRPMIDFQLHMYYKTLPLEDCELVEEKKIVGDEVEFDLGDKTATVSERSKDSLDENGQYRGTRFMSDGRVYFTVLQKNAEDDFSARLYRIPEELVITIDNVEQFKAKLNEFGGKRNEKQ